MNCSIISIGTELNLGLVLDINSRYIAEKITGMGIDCKYIFTVGDDVDDISGILKHSLKYSDLVIINGGLGPTDDDVTRKAVSMLLNIRLVRDKDLDDTSLKFSKETKNTEITKRLLRQSYIPENSLPLKPKLGSASGFMVITGDRKIIFCIPGVPREMRSMFESDVIPLLKEIIKDRVLKKNKLYIKKSTLLTTDISETEIEERIKEFINEAGKINVQIGITAAPGLTKIILISKAPDDRSADKNLKKIERKIIKKLGDCFYGKDDTIISEELKKTISRAGGGITISAAESVTGGLISSIITDTPGSSKFFLGSVISYSDYSKAKLLKIDESTLKKYGAVSEPVCLEMAKKVKKIFNSDFSLSVTGYAGPEAEDKNKLGLIYCCILGPDRCKKIFKKIFPGTRCEIKFRTAQFILNELIKELKGRAGSGKK